MRALIPAPVYLPLGGAAVALVLHRRLYLQRAVSIASVFGSLACAVLILISVNQSGPAAAHLGGWPAPIGIVLVADLYSALMLVVSSSAVAFVLIYSIGQLSVTLERRYFHPLYLLLVAGVSASFLTGDLFNLFVAFEVTLIASYALITLGGRSLQIRPSVTYVIVNIFASVLFLTAIAFVYASMGTVNMADLAGKVVSMNSDYRQALALVFLVVFGTKAALFPLFFWLPDSYPTAPTAITAIFAGLLTKIGVYSIFRIHSLIFGFSGLVRVAILALGVSTMLVGVLGAIAQDEIKRVLSFQIVSHVGFMIWGLGIATVAGIAGGILYTLHHIPVITSLFLVGGLVEKTTGTGSLHRLGGLARKMPVAAVLFFLAALSLSGIPPFSGFFVKVALLQAGIASGGYVPVVVGLIASLLTLFSMFKVWEGAFWGDPDESLDQQFASEKLRVQLPRIMVMSAAAVVVVSLAIAIGIEPLYQVCKKAAEGLVDPSSYIQVVMAR